MRNIVIWAFMKIISKEQVIFFSMYILIKKLLLNFYFCIEYTRIEFALS